MHRTPGLVSSASQHAVTLQQMALLSGSRVHSNPAYSLVQVAFHSSAGQLGLLHIRKPGITSNHSPTCSRNQRVIRCCSTLTSAHQSYGIIRHSWSCREAAAVRLLQSCCRTCRTPCCCCSPLHLSSSTHSSIRSLQTNHRGWASADSSLRMQHTAREADQTRSNSSSSSSPRPPAAAEITSTANPYIKHCVKLRQSAKYRQQQRRLLVVGSTILQELAEDATDLEVLVLFLQPGAALPSGITAQHIITVNDTVMKKLTGLEETAETAVVAELALPQFIQLTHNGSSSGSQPSSGNGLHTDSAAAGAHTQQQLQRLLVLESVQDPGNLGTLLRCAAAFGWDAVWLLPGCCDPFNDKALRASRGAALRVPLAAGGLQQLLLVVKQQHMLLLAAEPEAEQQVGSSSGGAYSTANSSSQHHRMDAGATTLQQPVCLVLGTEGAGLSDDVLRSATPVAIPMSGQMESLNVGVAGAILMFALSEGMPQLVGRLQQLRLS